MIPVILVCLGVAFQYAAKDYLGHRIYVYLYPMIFIGALLGPLTSGILAVFLASFSICYLFLPPLESFQVAATTDIVGISVFTVTGIFFNLFVRYQSRRLQEKSEESLKQFQSLANSMPQLAWIAKEDGFIYWYNERWYHYTGTTHEEMEGWGWKNVHHPDYINKVMTGWPESIKSGEPFEMEFPLRGSDGTFRWFLTRAFPLRNAKGEITRWFGTNTDIDVLKKAITVRDEFITLASHEFKTPITSLKLQNQMFHRKINLQSRLGPALEEQDQYLKTNLIQVDRLNVLVDELLDVSRIDLGKLHFDMHPCDLTQLAGDLVKRFAGEFAEKNCPLTFFPEETVIVHGDANRLEQIIVNLFSNAMKYSAGKPVRVRVRSHNGMGQFIIQDQGMGIGKVFQKRIFERFERGIPHDHISGLGLGLYIAQEIATNHRGSIEVESELGKGSTFYVNIPQAT